MRERLRQRLNPFLAGSQCSERMPPGSLGVLPLGFSPLPPPHTVASTRICVCPTGSSPALPCVVSPHQYGT
ncbi:hypothetical protein NDU88_004912 [Pleurodeles waltl]|uniref:Uncharacterized protein n=1 Tax=Pleurodeles waltl TaxID=8319 RepID=A0AAV7KZA2_PLEWA|nr:hypothetical protein NDU88_004912 [Pleurodeles waltl]